MRTMEGTKKEWKVLVIEKLWPLSEEKSLLIQDQFRFMARVIGSLDEYRCSVCGFAGAATSYWDS